MKPTPLDTATIYRQLTPTTQSLLKQLDCFDSLASTNTYLLQQTQEPTYTGAAVCLAECQTAGRGRHGRVWDSPSHAHIYCSVRWHFSCSIDALSGLSAAVGIALAQALEAYGIDDLGLKWPNDLYHSGRKLGGILIETDSGTGKPGHTRAIIGIGLNIHPTQDPAWISLSEILKANTFVDRNPIVAQLLNTLLPVLKNCTKDGLADYLTQWDRWDILAGRTICVRIPSQETYTGIAQGIDASGALLLQPAAPAARLRLQNATVF